MRDAQEIHLALMKESPKTITNHCGLSVPETCDALKLRPSGSVGYSTILWLYYCIIYSTLMVKIWENDDMLI